MSNWPLCLFSEGKLNTIWSVPLARIISRPSNMSNLLVSYPGYYPLNYICPRRGILVRSSRVWRKKEMNNVQVEKNIFTAHGDVSANEAIRDNIRPGYFTSSYFLGIAVVHYVPTSSPLRVLD